MPLTTAVNEGQPGTPACPQCAAPMAPIDVEGESVWRCAGCGRRTYADPDLDDTDLPPFVEDGVAYHGFGEPDEEATAELHADDEPGDEELDDDAEPGR